MCKWLCVCVCPRVRESIGLCVRIVCPRMRERCERESEKEREREREGERERERDVLVTHI